MKFEWMSFRNCEQIRKQWQVYDIFLFILMSSHGVSIVTETISNTQSEYVAILYQWEGGCLVGNKTINKFYEYPSECPWAFFFQLCEEIDNLLGKRLTDKQTFPHFAIILGFEQNTHGSYSCLEIQSYNLSSKVPYKL